jgi:subtilisin family serine protease
VWATGDTGQGITVGTSDTGVDGTHPRLADGYRGADDSWYDPWGGTRAPTDHIGHGSHTIGTAVGRDGIGVAPSAQWMACVNLDRDYGSPSHYLDCLQFMLAPFPYGGNAFSGNPARAADVLTNSWGCPAIEGCDLDALRPATAALAAAGIYVVAAAGNDGPDCDTVTDPPSPYPDVLTVGATAQDGTVASFSSRGPTPDGQVKPDLVAPGVNILSALPHGTYGRFEGTSMATPHVAGVVALMWSANPKLIGDIADTTRILRQTATRVPEHASDVCGSPQDITGVGLVNAAAAVSAARTLIP